MMFIKKEGPPIVIEVYVDGRAGVFMPVPFRLREKILGRMFMKSLRKNGGTKNIKPGRYYFNYTKVGAFSLEAELEPAE